ncbi:hypothetical protein [Culicoidibacter larvae]|uniref:Uncharacterized protein n=1 Tax=Culicoidibacter larvae TaxID=2579976 RepID=A0A5R8QHH0_9FIRM|nr:hypothetical protein [Culicoidibacter larvae]TLG77244.1 hypothetical protein FEZ08_01105 [Culicoidibacter larvae]
MKKVTGVLIFLAIIGGIGAGIYGIIMMFIELPKEMMWYLSRGDMSALFMLIPLILVPGSIIFALWIMYSVFIKPGRVNKRMQASGTKSVGFVKSLAQTGTYINEQPEVKFTVEILQDNGSMVEAEVKTIVALTDLAQLQPGVPIPVVYNPTTMECIFDNTPDTERLQDMIDRYQSSRDPRGLTYSERVEIRKHGIQTPAIIQDMKITGEQVGDKHAVVISIELPVTVLGSVQVVSREVFCAPAMLSELQIGKIINVQLLPAHPERFAIINQVTKDGL